MWFRRACVKEGTKLVVEHFADAWQLKKEHHQDYMDTLERRAMNIHRKVTQATGKRSDKQPKWTKSLPWKMEEDDPMIGETTGITPTAAQGTADAANKQSLEWQAEHLGKLMSERYKEGYSYGYGHDTEMKLAWRRSTKKSSKPELADWSGRADGDEDGAPLAATWADGLEARIFVVTVAEHESLVEARGKGLQAIVVCYEGEHKATHHRIKVCKRKDRYSLMSLYEQGLQRCSVQIFAFEGHDDCVPGEESAAAEAKAAGFMKDFGHKVRHGPYPQDAAV